MKKTIVLSSMMLVVLASFALALTLNNETPTDGSTVSGDVSAVTFSVDDNDDSATGGTLYIDTVGNWPLSCAGLSPTVCSVNIDLNAWAEGDYDYYFFVTDGILPAYDPANASAGGRFTFTLDKIPLAASFLSVNGVDEFTLNLDWTASSSTDIDYYNIYNNDTGSFILDGTSSGTDYNDTGLTTGNTYCYFVTAVDLLGQESGPSTTECQLVADSTPPVDPVITPISGTTVNTTTPNITIDYTAGAENVSLEIYSGATLVESFATLSDFFNWNPMLNSNTTYVFTFVAEDMFGNQKNTTYGITTNDLPTMNGTVLDTIHITIGNTPVIVSALPGQYFLYKYDISMFGGDYLRVQMTDLVSAAQTIDVDSESAPIAFCGEDYDAVAQDVVAVPTKNVYNVQNAFDETPGNALDCADTDPSGEVAYDIYLKIPLPLGIKSGAYNWDVDLGMYDTP